MKRVLLILGLTFALISCEKEPSIPTPGIPTEGMKIVEKITGSSDMHNWSYELIYDSSNRLIEIKTSAYDLETYKITYSKGTITTKYESNDIYTEEVTSTATIDKNNRVISITDHQYHGENDETYNYHSLKYDAEGQIASSQRKAPASETMYYYFDHKFSWNNGNLTGMEYKGFAHAQDQESDAGNGSATITYLENAKNDKINLDLNWLLINDQGLSHATSFERKNMFNLLGYSGTKSENYMASLSSISKYNQIHGDIYEFEYEYEFDADGCPTEIRIFKISKEDRTLSETLTITYKK